MDVRFCPHLTFWSQRGLPPQVTPRLKEPSLGYAYFWWTILNSQAFTALGGEGQFIYVDPASKTVVVKMSHGPVGPAAQANEQEALRFFTAVSHWGSPR